MNIPEWILTADPVERDDILHQIADAGKDDFVDPEESLSQVGEKELPGIELELLRKQRVIVVLVSVDTMNHVIESQLTSRVAPEVHVQPSANVDVEGAMAKQSEKTNPPICHLVRSSIAQKPAIRLGTARPTPAYDDESQNGRVLRSAGDTINVL